MLFWKNRNFIKHVTKASLQAKPPLMQNAEDLESRPKRVSCFTSREYHASLSLEAAVAFSFFLFFLVNIFSLIRLFHHYGKGLEELQQRGKQLAMYAYAGGSLTDGNDELIRLYNTETVKSVFGMIAAPTAALPIQCVVKPWTGYDVNSSSVGSSEEEIVYITNNREVYHKSRSCTHLSLSIQIADSGKVSRERNQSGGRYYPCEYCGDGGFLTVVFLTTHGDRYHRTLNCRGLKRNIREVYLSQVKELPVCSKCG